MSKKSLKKQLLNRRRHDFLLTFFSQPFKYQVKELNGYYLVCQLNTANNPEGEWEVAIYDQDSWKKKQSFIDERANLFTSK